MTDIKKKLQMWKESTPNGTYETRSTISIKTDTMDVTVHGNSLEEAYAQLEAICNKQAPVLENEAVQQPSTFPQNSMLEAFGDKKPVRIFSPGAVLAPGESTVTYGGTTYVVK